jgi:hypothetical protein
MEGSKAPFATPAVREPGTLRVAQVGLLIACLGAVLVIFNFFGLATAGLFLAVGGAALAAPGGAGKRWYVAVAAGAIVMVLSRLIAESAETLGGWLGVFGSLSILIGTALGFPGQTDEES